MSDVKTQGKIGLIPCLAFAVGTMVGGGVFTLSGTAINHAGPEAILSYLIAGVVMLLSALCFVAVAGRAAPGDSGYGPISDLLGPGWRFITMWCFYLNAVFLIAFLAVSFGEYLNNYFISGLGPLAAAVVALIIVAALNLGPADLVGKAETVVVGIKIALLVFFIVWGLTAVGAIDTSAFPPHSRTSVFTTASLLFTAFTGFNVVTNMAGSLAKPERDVPVAVIGSIFISAVIYVGVIIAMLASGLTHFGPAGVGEAATALMGNWGGYLIAFAACLSTLSGANANVLGASEITLRLVVQNDVPPEAGKLTRQGHPIVSVALIAAVTVMLTVFTNVDNVVAYANVCALVAMVIVDVACFRLYQRKWAGKGMHLVGGPLIPIIAGLACLVQFPSFSTRQVVIGLAFIFAGWPLYAYRHDERVDETRVRHILQGMERLDTPLRRALLPSFPFWRVRNEETT